jgi:hypothetical protein
MNWLRLHLTTESYIFCHWYVMSNVWRYLRACLSSTLSCYLSMSCLVSPLSAHLSDSLTVCQLSTKPSASKCLPSCWYKCMSTCSIKSQMSLSLSSVYRLLVLLSTVSTLIKKKRKFSSYLRKFRWEQLQSLLIYEKIFSHI